MVISGDGGWVALICVGVFFLVVVVLLLLSLGQTSRRRKGFAAAVTGLGFAPQSKPDVELLARVQEVFQRSKVMKISNVAEKLFGDERYFIFDCMYTSPSYTSSPSTSHSSSSMTEYNNVAVISPHLDLPPFVILSRTKAPGALAGIADNVLAMAAASAGLREYSEVPTVFQMNYMLFINDETRARETFTDALLNQIGMMDGVIARGCGQCLVVNHFTLRTTGKWDSGKLSEQVALARQMTDLLVK
jgi:hypothetical protein